MNLEALFWVILLTAPLGSFLLSRRWSFFGDALSHASLAGVGLAVVLGFTTPIALAVGAVLSGLTLGGLTNLLEKFGRLPGTVALTASYLGLFAVGLCFLGGSHVHFESLLLGQSSSFSAQGMTTGELWFLRLWTVAVWLLLILKWKRIWLVVTDPSFARGLGIRVKLWELAFLVMTCVSVVILVKAVGAVLVGAILILPTSTAFLFSRGLKSQVFYSVLMGLVGAGLGYFVFQEREIPLGPAIGFSSFFILLITLLLYRGVHSSTEN